MRGITKWTADSLSALPDLLPGATTSGTESHLQFGENAEPRSALIDWSRAQFLLIRQPDLGFSLTNVCCVDCRKPCSTWLADSSQI